MTVARYTAPCAVLVACVLLAAATTCVSARGGGGGYGGEHMAAHYAHMHTDMYTIAPNAEFDARNGGGIGSYCHYLSSGNGGASECVITLREVVAGERAMRHAMYDRMMMPPPPPHSDGDGNVVGAPPAFFGGNGNGNGPVHHSGGSHHHRGRQWHEHYSIEHFSAAAAVQKQQQRAVSGDDVVAAVTPKLPSAVPLINKYKHGVLLARGRDNDGELHGMEGGGGDAFEAAAALTVEYGNEMKSLYYLSPGLAYLNHGSFSACPRPTLDYWHELAIQMEHDSQAWMAARGGMQTDVRTQVAERIHANVTDVVLVLDATAGLNAIFRSIEFGPDDTIMYLNLAYGALIEMCNYVHDRYGATLLQVDITFPLASPEALVATVEQAFADNPGVTFAAFSHIASASALVLPVADLIRVAHEHDAMVLIDGAHAFGQLDLDLNALRPDFYTSDSHKWMMSPKGSAWLWVAPERQSAIVPVSISFGYNTTFVEDFKWIGTQDFSAYYSIPAAMEWRDEIGGDAAVHTYNDNLAAWAAEMLSNVWGTADMYPIAPADMFASMTMVYVPPTETLQAGDFSSALLADYDTETSMHELQDEYDTIIRVSAQVYNVEREYLRLAEAVLEILADAEPTAHNRALYTEGMRKLAVYRELVTAAAA